MSREILYRGFHECENGTEQIQIDGRVIRGEWVYGQRCSDGKAVWLVSNNDFYETKEIGERLLRSDIFYKVIPETVCQYTGKTDKNGNKIFFGDKLKIATPTIKDGKREDVAIVKWNERYSKIDLKVYHKGKYKRTTNFSNLFFYGGGEAIGTKFDVEVEK